MFSTLISGTNRSTLSCEETWECKVTEAKSWVWKDNKCSRSSVIHTSKIRGRFYTPNILQRRVPKYIREGKCLCLPSIAMINTMTKSNWDWKSLFQFILPYNSPSLREVMTRARGETWRQKLRQQCCLLACFSLLALFVSFCLFGWLDVFCLCLGKGLVCLLECVFVCLLVCLFVCCLFETGTHYVALAGVDFAM